MTTITTPLRPLYTVTELLGGPYPDTSRAEANCDVIADLLAHLCLQRADLDLNGCRWFFHDAGQDDWSRIIGTRYPFDTLRVCTTIASHIIARRQLLGPRVSIAGGPLATDEPVDLAAAEWIPQRLANDRF